jgi:hypothetical protein
MYKQPSLLVTTNSSSKTQCEEQSGSVCLVKRDGKDNVWLSTMIQFFRGNTMPFLPFLFPRPSYRILNKKFNFNTANEYFANYHMGLEK